MPVLLLVDKLLGNTYTTRLQQSCLPPNHNTLLPKFTFINSVLVPSLPAFPVHPQPRSEGSSLGGQEVLPQLRTERASLTQPSQKRFKICWSLQDRAALLLAFRVRCLPTWLRPNRKMVAEERIERSLLAFQTSTMTT